MAIDHLMEERSNRGRGRIGARGFGRNNYQMQQQACVSGNTEFGNAYYSNNIIGNILSFGQCVDYLYMVDYIKSSDVFVIQPEEGGRLFEFKRNRNVNLYVCDMFNSNSHSVLVSTVWRID